MENKVQAKKQQGNGYFNKKQFQRAKKAYLQALEMDPKHLSSLNNLSNVYFILEDFQKSVEVCKRAIAIDPKIKKTYYRMTLSFSKLQKPFEVIEWGRKFLKLENEEKVKNIQAIQIIKTTIKQAKDKILNLVQNTQPPELNFIKNPIITTQPNALKQIKAKLTKKQFSLQELQEELKYILSQSLKAYSVQICIQFDNIKRSLYKQILELEKDEYKKQQIINILLATAKQEKKQLLLKKLSLSYLKNEQKIVVMKSLLAIVKKDEDLQSQIKQLQKKIKKSFQQQSSNQTEQKQNIIMNNNQINANSKSKGLQKDQIQTSSTKIQSQHSIHTQIIKPFCQLFSQKLKNTETHRNIQQFFNLFKFVNQCDESDEQKIKYIKLLKERSQKSEKNYIKKMCKQLGKQQLFGEFKS